MAGKLDRRQPLLLNSRRSGSLRFAEVAGGTTAECAAVCCCCPCGLVNLLILAVYKLPAGICRKAIRRSKRRKMMKKPAVSSRCGCGCDDTELEIQAVTGGETLLISVEEDKDVVELEKEMWERFYGTGFWRSPSQRDNV